VAKTYLVVLSGKYPHQAVVDYLDKHPRIDNWFFSFPNSVFVVTEMSARELSRVIQAPFGKYRHFVTRVSTDRWGRLPTKHWTLFK
jgi:hypothetical protein